MIYSKVMFRVIILTTSFHAYSRLHARSPAFTEQCKQNDVKRSHFMQPLFTIGDFLRFKDQKKEIQ